MASPLRVQEFLRKLPLFRELDDNELDKLATATSQLRAAPGTILFRRGDPCTGLHVIVYGQVKLAISDTEGGEKVVEIHGPGQSFGDALLFLDRPHMAFAEVLSDALVLHVGRAALFAEIDANPAFARKMLAGLSARLQRFVTDLESVSLKNGTQRVIGFLLRDVPEGAAEHTLDVELPATKGTVASRLNITREHFSRILRELTDARLIQVDGRIIHIPDVESLRAHGA